MSSSFLGIGLGGLGPGPGGNGGFGPGPGGNGGLGPGPGGNGGLGGNGGNNHHQNQYGTTNPCLVILGS